MISFQIVTYNSALCIEESLNSIIRLGLLEYEILIFDNNSKDETVSTIEKFIAQNKNLKIIIIKNSENIGFGAGHNRLANIAKGDILFLLNPDTILSYTEDVEKKLHKIGEENAVTGIYFKYGNGVTQHTISRAPNIFRIVLDRIPLVQKFFGIKVRLNSDYKIKHNVAWLHGCGLILAKSVYQKLNGFDETFFMYCEDIDLCLRASKLGIAVVYDPALEGIHFKDGMLPSRRPNKYFFIRFGFLQILTSNNSKIEVLIYKLAVLLEAFFIFIFSFFVAQGRDWRDAVKRVLRLI